VALEESKMTAAQLVWRSGTSEYLYRSCQVSDLDSSPANQFGNRVEDDQFR
jgi:hypothetical protein